MHGGYAATGALARTRNGASRPRARVRYHRAHTQPRYRVPTVSVQPLRVGVIGAGTVGREVVRAFLEQSPRLAPIDGTPLVLTAVAEKFTERAIASGIPADLLTDAPAHMIASDDVDIVVETMGGNEPAHTLVAAALAAGKHVVTANKHIVAHHGPELERLARASGATFRFEAAVGGGIPLLSPIAQDLAANRIARVRGIVNGTTNYMLTAMTREGREYAEVLAEAQAKGYAEADPTADVEGLDALNKLMILVRLAFGAWISPDAIGNRPGTTTGAPGLPAHPCVSLPCPPMERSAGTWLAPSLPRRALRGPGSPRRSCALPNAPCGTS